MKLIYTICYISKTAENMTDDQIEQLFEYTSSNNETCEVSGILLHSMGNFFQVLEGQEKHLLELYEKIKKDKRHTDIYEVYNKKTAHPTFINYQSKFDIVKSPSDLKTIIEYLNVDSFSSSNLKLKRLLKPFAMLDGF